MPQYLYKCVTCQKRDYIFHSMDERQYDCPWCSMSNTLVKIPAKFNFAKKIKKLWEFSVLEPLIYRRQFLWKFQSKS